LILILFKIYIRVVPAFVEQEKIFVNSFNKKVPDYTKLLDELIVKQNWPRLKFALIYPSDCNSELSDLVTLILIIEGTIENLLFNCDTLFYFLKTNLKALAIQALKIFKANVTQYLTQYIINQIKKYIILITLNYIIPVDLIDLIKAFYDLDNLDYNLSQFNKTLGEYYDNLNSSGESHQGSDVEMTSNSEILPSGSNNNADESADNTRQDSEDMIVDNAINRSVSGGECEEPMDLDNNTDNSEGSQGPHESESEDLNPIWITNDDFTRGPTPYEWEQSLPPSPSSCLSPSEEEFDSISISVNSKGGNFFPQDSENADQALEAFYNNTADVLDLDNNLNPEEVWKAQQEAIRRSVIIANNHPEYVTDNEQLFDHNRIYNDIRLKRGGMIHSPPSTDLFETRERVHPALNEIRGARSKERFADYQENIRDLPVNINQGTEGNINQGTRSIINDWFGPPSTVPLERQRIEPIRVPSPNPVAESSRMALERSLQNQTTADSISSRPSLTSDTSSTCSEGTSLKSYSLKESILEQIEDAKRIKNKKKTLEFDIKEWLKDVRDPWDYKGKGKR
jgi:hypothetical protein